MKGGRSLGQRLAGYKVSDDQRIERSSFDHVHMRGLRPRIEAMLDQAVGIFELDRLLYDIEVDAQHEWLRRMMAFDAYCARRDRDARRAADGGPGTPPVR
jgi:hypothetical protein